MKIAPSTSMSPGLSHWGSGQGCGILASISFLAFLPPLIDAYASHFQQKHLNPVARNGLG